MLIMFKYLAISVLILVQIQNAFSIDYDGWLNIKVDHTLNCKGEKYCSRGSISLKSIRAGTAVIDQILLNKQHIEELKSLAEIGDFYSIRTIVSSADNMGTEFLSSIKAQTFLDNGLTDVVNAWVLPNGAVIAVSFQATNSSQTPMQKTQNGHKINSNFYLHHVDHAPVPDTASYIQKLERERDAREKGEVKDNRSFLAKYWMYIVPVAIFVMISGATNPEPAAQGSR